MLVRGIEGRAGEAAGAVGASGAAWSERQLDKERKVDALILMICL